MRKLITLICCFTFLLGYSQNEELESLTIQLAFQDADTLKVNTSIRVINILYNDAAYDKALKYIRESEKLSNDLNYKQGIAEISYFKGLIFAKKMTILMPLTTIIDQNNFLAHYLTLSE